jgi:hypothetical protein
VLAPALTGPNDPLTLCAPVERHREALVLALALLSVLLGLLPLTSFGILQIGRLNIPTGVLR